MARSKDSLKEAKWLGLLGQWQRSGQTIAAFCAQAGVRQQVFFRWRRVLSQRGLWPQKSSELPLFVPVDVTPDPVGAAIEVVLSGGVVVRVRPGFDVATLQEVLSVLEGHAC